MPTLVLTAILFVFIIWLQYEIRKTSSGSKKVSDRFWEKENISNAARRKDISLLNYIAINKEVLPLEDSNDATIDSYRDLILDLTDKKIVNLSGYTNTELKNLYGIANINLLTEYDNNYITLISILQKWAERLYAADHIPEAICVLEYAVTCRTDVSKTYKLLAEIYKQQNTPEKLDSLLLIIESISIYGKDKLIQEINAFLVL